MTSRDVGWGRAAGGRAGCGGGELVEITSQLHRALPCLDQPWLQWEEPADYSGWLNHPSITWNFHTQPSINISPPPVKEEISNIANNRASFLSWFLTLFQNQNFKRCFFPAFVLWLRAQKDGDLSGIEFPRKSETKMLLSVLSGKLPAAVCSHHYIRLGKTTLPAHFISTQGGRTSQKHSKRK